MIPDEEAIIPNHYMMGDRDTMDYTHDVCRHNASFTALDGYQAGSLIKYISRAGMKGNKLRDLKKAQEHLRRWIAEIEKEEDSI